MLSFDNLHLSYQVNEGWGYETVLKPKVEVTRDYETGESHIRKAYSHSPTSKDYDLVRIRKIQIDASFMGVEISSLTMMAHVYGHIESWLYRKLGEYRDELKGRGGESLGGYLYFGRRQKDGKEYLHVTVRADGAIVRDEYFSYPDVAQLKQAMQKLISSVRV